MNAYPLARAAARSLVLLLALGAAASAADVYYHSDWSAPRLHAEGPSGWGRPPGSAMTALGSGWWHAATPGTVGEFLFNDGRGRWDHAPWPTGPNYQNAKGASELWVRDGRVTYAPPGAGRVEELRVRSRILGGRRRISVYLPALYDIRKTRRYPVLYLQDGQNLFDRQAFFGGWAADTAVEETTQAGEAAQVIIVGIHNTAARMREYTPTRDPLYGGGGADRYLDFLVRELKPWVDRRWRTRPDASQTGIGGSSLGGLLALHAGLARPQVFGRVLSMSPSLWWDSGELLGRVQGLARVPAIRVYLDSGGPSDGQKNAEQMRDLLAARGLRFGQTLWHWSEPTHQHNEMAWRERLPRALSLLYPAR